jgi:5-methylcytosine-specific restriction enzyme A
VLHDAILQFLLGNAMPSFLLTWSPKLTPSSSISEIARAIHEDGSVVRRWSVSKRNKGLPVDSRVYMLRQRSGLGVVGFGVTVSCAEEHTKWREGLKSETSFHVNVRWEYMQDVVVVPEPLVTRQRLLELSDNNYKWAPRESGSMIPSEYARALWTEIASLGSAEGHPDHYLPEYIEGSTREVTLTSRERNPAARKACLEHYKWRCQACEVRLDEVYGNAAAGLIHVHHKNPLANADGARGVNYIEDLVPLCPNCHGVAHYGMPRNEPRSVEKIRQLLQQNLEEVA